jgi:hypothetical protein
MSLTSHQLEVLLLNGFSCSSDQREFSAKLSPMSDVVTINEMSRLSHGSLPVAYIMDQARANESGSDVADDAAFRRLVGQLAARAV